MDSVLTSFKLTNRRALVTGGARGLGRVMADALAEAGADVAITSRTIASAQDAAAEIARATGRKVVGLDADVSRASDVTRLVDQARERRSAGSTSSSTTPASTSAARARRWRRPTGTR